MEKADLVILNFYNHLEKNIAKIVWRTNYYYQQIYIDNLVIVGGITELSRPGFSIKTVFLG